MPWPPKPFPYVPTVEHRRKLSIAQTGKRMSLAARRNMSLAARRRVQWYTSALEIRAGTLMARYGLRSKVWLRPAKHTFDYGSRSLKVLVEINGCYWHSHKCAFSGKRPERIRRDRFLARWAKRNGYLLIALWECEEKKWPSQMARLMK